MNDVSRSWCCHPDCNRQPGTAVHHVQGYHDDTPWYDDCTHSCDAHLAEMLEGCNGLSHWRKLEPSKPATYMSLEQHEREYNQWKEDQNALADAIMIGPTELAKAILDELRSKPS